MAEEVKELSVFPMGEENPFGQYFTGKSYRKALSSEQVKVSNITFTPGCRNHWHIHHAETGGGQMLARRGEGQLVPAYRDRGPGHQDKYRVV